MKIKKITVFLFVLVLLFCNLKEITAEELINEYYKVYIENQEITEYNLIEDKDIKINQVYNGDNLNFTFGEQEEFIIDYSNNLYGKYNYTFSLFNFEEIIDSRNIIINYIGDNNEFINTNNIYYKDKTYYILGDLNKELTVLDILSLFNQNLDYYNAKLTIINDEEIELTNEEIVENGNKLKLTATYLEHGNKNDIIDYFNINIVNDFNNDNIINNLDIKSLIIDNILNNNDIFNITDIPKVDNNTITNSTDKINKTISYNNELYKEEILEIKYYLNGFKYDDISSIIGKINYNKDYFELINININNKIYGNYNNIGNFSYLINNYKENGLFITFQFKALKIGNSNISLENIEFITSKGDYLIIEDPLFNIEIPILEYGKGGDVDNTIKEEITPPQKEIIPLDNKEVINNNVVIYEELLPSKTIEQISLSNDNYIKTLKIKGYKIKFDKNIEEYSIKIENNIDKLNFDIELNDNDSYYTIIGNKNLKEGKNKILITVTALDGSTRTYTINVEKEKNISKKENNNSKNIIITLIILIIIGLIYIIFKSDEEDNI